MKALAENLHGHSSSATVIGPLPSALSPVLEGKMTTIYGTSMVEVNEICLSTAFQNLTVQFLFGISQIQSGTDFALVGASGFLPIRSEVW